MRRSIISDLVNRDNLRWYSNFYFHLRLRIKRKNYFCLQGVIILLTYSCSAFTEADEIILMLCLALIINIVSLDFWYVQELLSTVQPQLSVSPLSVRRIIRAYKKSVHFCTSTIQLQKPGYIWDQASSEFDSCEDFWVHI